MILLVLKWLGIILGGILALGLIASLGLALLASWATGFHSDDSWYE